PVGDAGLPVRLTPAPDSGTPAPPPADAPPVGEMSLVGHLTELRDRLVKVVIAVAVASIVGFYFGDQIVAILRAPVPGNQPLSYTGVGDAFAIRLKISLVVGIILAMPVILFQVWRFVAPGLTAHESHLVRAVVTIAHAFFALGTGIAYFVLPFAATFLLSFS